MPAKFLISSFRQQEQKKIFCFLGGGFLFLFACLDINFPYISLHIRTFRILEKGRQAEGWAYLNPDINDLVMIGGPVSGLTRAHSVKS